MTKIGWNFPSNSGGSFDGFNDSGIETFAGNPFGNLTREILQNSLDAAADKNDAVTVDAVTVEFVAGSISKNDFPGVEEFEGTIEKCVRSARNIQKDEKAIKFFEDARKVLGKKTINYLKISDTGTTGLAGNRWDAITKQRGVSAKDDSTAGGSYGIGKHASFAVSKLRTVFYSSYDIANGAVQKMAQGKAILMSHDLNGKSQSQGTGFYGIKDNCEPIEGNGVPKFLTRKEPGTTVFIPGFSAENGWERKLVATVLVNFFYAISTKKLCVRVRTDSGSVPIIIDSKNLDSKFDEYAIQNEVRKSGRYYNAWRKEKCIYKELRKLGLCKLWISIDGDEQDDGDEKSVAILRKTGMIITSSLQGLRRWVGYSDFAAICICVSKKGNELLRQMENPQHNTFESDRLGNSKKYGDDSINELTKWIRAEVKKLATVKTSDSVILDEFAEFFPDKESDPGLPGDGERHLEGMAVYRPRPYTTALSILHDAIGEDGAGDEYEHGEGKKGDGKQTENGKGGTKQTKNFEIRDVRVISSEGDTYSKYLYFTPRETGDMLIKVFVAGDSPSSDIAKIKCVKVAMGAAKIGSAKPTTSIKIKINEEERIKLAVTFEENITDALVVVGYKEISKKVKKS